MKYRLLPDEKIKLCWKALMHLIRNPWVDSDSSSDHSGDEEPVMRKVHDDESAKISDDEEPELRRVRRVRRAGEHAEPGLDPPSCFDILHNSLKDFQCVPVHLGLGRAATQDKLAALVYACYMATGWDHLSSFFDSVVSITTDMGTELGIADYQINGVTHVLPNWLTRAKLQSDVDTGVIWESINKYL